jgi:hypothetical protein
MRRHDADGVRRTAHARHLFASPDLRSGEALRLLILGTGFLPKGAMERQSPERFSRRELLRGAGWRTLARELASMLEPPESHSSAPTQDPVGTAVEAYFASALSNYPILQEVPWAMVLDEARARGIPTEGRPRHEIARDLFARPAERRA